MGVTPRELKEVIEKLIKDGLIVKGGVGLYKTFVHYDVRGRNARWLGKGVKDDRNI
jgi:predicted transcriptional regulator